MSPKISSKKEKAIKDIVDGAESKWNQGDVDFIMACLKYPSGGSVSVS
jgi:hypothetical protein